MVKMNNLFVSNLSHNTSFIQLAAIFLKIGKVLNAKVAIDRDGACKGYGFVEMATEKDARRALAELNHCLVNGMKIEILEAKPAS